MSGGSDSEAGESEERLSDAQRLEILSRNIRSELQRRGLDIKTACRAAGLVPSSTAQGWAEGAHEPSLFGFLNLAETLGASLGDLLDGLYDKLLPTRGKAIFSAARFEKLLLAKNADEMLAAVPDAPPFAVGFSIEDDDEICDAADLEEVRMQVEKIITEKLRGVLRRRFVAAVKNYEDIVEASRKRVEDSTVLSRFRDSLSQKRPGPQAEP